MNGYKIIDFKGESLNEGHVPGIWNAVANATKPLVFCNFSVGDSDEIQKPYFAGFGIYRSVDANTHGYDFVLTVTNDGAVIFTITDKDDIVMGA